MFEINNITQYEINILERTFIRWHYKNNDVMQDTIVFEDKENYEQALKKLKRKKVNEIENFN